MCPSEILKTTCPRDCYDGCGLEVVKSKDRISRVLGAPGPPVSRGGLCSKCAIAYNGVWLDSDTRLLHPMRRSGPKGSRRFERISWEEALAEIAGNLTRISSEYRADAILHTHYTGTCSWIANSFPNRFFSRLGATEATPDTICNNAGHLALEYVFGASDQGFDPRTAKDARCIVLWGANPSHSAPHAHKYWLKENSARVVVIDPVRHDTATEADLHLQLFPGTDAALAFGFLHIARRENLLDHDYILRSVLGYEEVEADIEAATPEWTSEKTGVGVGLIEEAARLYAVGPSLLWLGQGLQRQPSGGNIFRACSMLPALTGNIGKPGSGFYYLNDGGEIIASQGAPPKWNEREEGGAPTPSISQMDVPDALNEPDRFKAYMVWNCNPAASNPAQARIRAGLAREDLFTVVIDCFQTDTADYADIVLPAASFLEFDDLAGSYFHLLVGAQVKCAEPMGESLPNQEIFRRLSRAMGFEESFLYHEDAAMLESMLGGLGLGLSFDELKKKGWTWGSDEPLLLWSEGTFPTPSGKIEIASARAEADGHPRKPQPTADPRPQNGRFRLLSPASKWLMNSSYGNDAQIQKLMGTPTVAIHPSDAHQLGIQEGEKVVLSNNAGRLSLTAIVSEIIPPGSLLSYKSRWPKAEDGHNINLLHIPRKTDMGESTSVHGVEVSLTRA